MEWIYEYKIQTPWFKIAKLKKKFISLYYTDCKGEYYIEWRRNGHWRGKEICKMW